MHIGRVCVLPAEGDVVDARWQPCFSDLVLADMPVPVVCPLPLLIVGGDASFQ